MITSDVYLILGICCALLTAGWMTGRDDAKLIARTYHQCAGTLTVQGGPDDRLRLVCTLDGGVIGFMEPLE